MTNHTSPTSQRADNSRTADLRPSEGRAMETREISAPGYVPPSVMPDPRPQPGWVFGWIRISVYGEPDIKSVNAALSEGWVPCKRQDHPEIRMNNYGGFRNDAPQGDEVIVGGLMLCKKPVEQHAAKQKYFNDLTERQIQGVEAAYKSNAKADPRMPLDQMTVSSDVEFGKSSKRSSDSN